MIEKPILFNTEMVKAILQGRKTATRRIAKPKVEARIKPGETFTPVECDDGSWTLEIDQYPGTIYEGIYYPPCFPDDILYVRETWGLYHQEPFFFVYKADSTPDNEYDSDPSWKWRPSIHMPKSAARIFLKVTNVTLERLQSIDAVGIGAEGVSCPQAMLDAFPDDLESMIRYENELREKFKRLWDGTVNKKDIDRFGFDADPLVWVIEFEKIKQ